MSNLIQKIRDFYDSFDCVDSADCQAIYFRDGIDSSGERSDIHCFVKMTDGEEFHELVRKTGCDYRLLSDKAEDMFYLMIKGTFRQHLDRKAG